MSKRLKKEKQERGTLQGRGKEGKEWRVGELVSEWKILSYSWLLFCTKAEVILSWFQLCYQFCRKHNTCSLNCVYKTIRCILSALCTCVSPFVRARSLWNNCSRSLQMAQMRLNRFSSCLVLSCTRECGKGWREEGETKYREQVTNLEFFQALPELRRIFVALG